MFTILYTCSQSEAVVNAGPAVFISSSGPNPLMVQVLLASLTDVPIHLNILLTEELFAAFAIPAWSKFWYPAFGIFTV